MQLNHIDLQVPDVQATAAFFEQWLGFTHVSNRASPAIAILRGEAGFVLVIQRREPGERYPSAFHVGFLVDDEAQVIDFHRRLREAGFVVGDVQRNGRGTLLYFHAPGEILIEVSYRPK